MRHCAALPQPALPPLHEPLRHKSGNQQIAVCGQPFAFTAVSQASAAWPLPHALSPLQCSSAVPRPWVLPAPEGQAPLCYRPTGCSAQSSSLPPAFSSGGLGAVSTVLSCPKLLRVACWSAASPSCCHTHPVQFKTAGHLRVVCKLPCCQSAVDLNIQVTTCCKPPGVHQSGLGACSLALRGWS